MEYDPSTKGNHGDVSINCLAADENERHRNLHHQLPVNTILRGRYLIGRVLGEGGFGITYEGQDLKLQCRVAIKEFFLSGRTSRTGSLTVVPNDKQTTVLFESGKSRFLDEARVLAQFAEEPNIVQVRDYFEENGTGYIIMEFLKGQDLDSLLKREGAMPYERVLELLEPAMLALDRVHQKGLIHRDISPSNLMLLEDGTIKLLDFGTARNQSLMGQHSLSVMLKPGFAPEEQYRRHGEQGPWTDVYAMSATFYKLLTGVTPPPATDRGYEDTLELPSKLGAAIKPAQEQALLRGLALRPKDRIQSMKELAQCLKGEKKLRPRLPQKALIAAAAALVLLGGGLGIGSLLRDSAQKAPQETASSQTSGQPEEERQGRWVLGEEDLVIKETQTCEDGSPYKVINYDYDEYGNKISSVTGLWFHGLYSVSIIKTQWEEANSGWTPVSYISIDNNGNETRTEYRMEYREEEGAEVKCRYLNDVLQGWSVEEEGESSENYFSRTTYEYVPNGSLEQYYFFEEFFREDGTTLIKTQTYDAQGELLARTESVYDEKWNVLSTQRYYTYPGEETLLYDESYVYDKDGKALSGTVKDYTLDGSVEIYTVSYEHETRQVYHWEWDDE